MFVQQNTSGKVKQLSVGTLCLILSACATTAPSPEPEPIAEPEPMAVQETVMDAAQKPTEILITTSSEQARELFLQGRQAAENLRYGAARELLTEAIEADSGFAMAYLVRGGPAVAESAQQRKQDLEKAVELASTVSEGEQMLIEALQAFYLDSDLARWAELTEELAGMYPQDKRIRSNLAFVYQNYHDDRDGAIAQWEAAVGIDPDFAPPYNSLGYAYRAEGEYDKAEEAFANYIRLIPDEPNPHDSMGELLMKQGRYTEAIEHFQKALELDSSFTVSQRSIGITRCWMGQFDEGRAAVQQAIEMTPTPSGKATHHGSLARAWLYEGNLEQALGAFDRAAQMCTEAGLPRRAALYHLGKTWVSYEMGELDQAEAALADCRTQLQSAEIVPYYRDLYAQFALYWDALIAAGRGDFDAALMAGEEHKAKLKQRQDPSAEEVQHGLLGLIATQRGNYEEAIAHFQQADHEDPYVLYHWAKAESGTGNEDRATELFQKTASWNEDSWPYAFVRTRALAALEQ